MRCIDQLNPPPEADTGLEQFNAQISDVHYSSDLDVFALSEAKNQMRQDALDKVFVTSLQGLGMRF